MRFALLLLLTFSCKRLTCTVSVTRSTLTKYEQYPLIKFLNRYDDLSELVVFLLFTRSNPDKGQRLWIDDVKTLDASNFNVSLPTKIVTHGWTSSCNNTVCVGIRQGFLSHQNYNVITVDWSPIAQRNYMEAAVDVRSVGRYVARMVDFLKSRGSNPKTMTLVGHSLGGHVVGLAGRNLTTKVGHVVGMDPAGPGFEMQSQEGRISSLSGDLVEIIHTDTGVLGMIRAIGHQDYYPNGGLLQPGCKNDMTTSCSHGRSYVYYAEALQRPEDWLAVHCSSYGQFLADDCDDHVRVAFPRWAPDYEKPLGVYMLRTAASEPYGLGFNGTRPERVVE